MSGMKISKGEFDKQLELLLAPQIKAGFPSPAQDYMRERALTSMISNGKNPTTRWSDIIVLK